MKITLQLLRDNDLQLLSDNDACEEYIKLFEATFGESAEFNELNWDKANNVGLDLDWMECLLAGEFLKDYNAKVKPIKDHYYAKMKLIDDDYRAKMNLIKDHYYAKMKSILFDALKKQFKAEAE